MPRIRKLLRKASISLAALTVAFLITEVLTRSLEPGPFTFFDRNPYVTHPDDTRVVRHRPGFEGHWEGTW